MYKYIYIKSIFCADRPVILLARWEPRGLAPLVRRPFSLLMDPGMDPKWKKLSGRSAPPAGRNSISIRRTEARSGGRRGDGSSVPPDSVRRTEAPVRRTELGGTELPSPLRPADRASVRRTNLIPSGGRSTPSPAFPRRTKRKRSWRMMGFVRGRTAADGAGAASSPDADLRPATKRRRPERTKPAERTNRLPRGPPLNSFSCDTGAGQRAESKNANCLGRGVGAAGRRGRGSARSMLLGGTQKKWACVGKPPRRANRHAWRTRPELAWARVPSQLRPSANSLGFFSFCCRAGLITPVCQSVFRRKPFFFWILPPPHLPTSLRN